MADIVSEAKKRNNAKWDKDNVKRFNVALMKKGDADIIKKLESVDNRNNYIRQLIRADIEQERK